MASPGLYWSMLILLEFILSFAASELTNSPKIQTLHPGETVNIPCSTNLKTFVVWKYQSKGPAASRVHVYRGSFGMDSAYKDNKRYEVDEDKTAGHYNLSISDVQSSDAGTYICIDNDELGEEISNEVIILSDSPSCGSNIASGEAVGENNCGLESEDIELKCSVKYLGNVPPIMEFKNTDNNDVITAGVRNFTLSGSEVVYTLTLKSSIDVDTSKFSCAVRHDFLGNSANISAYMCLLKRINILYAFGVSPSLVNVNKDKTRICTADANLKNCTYLWKDTKTDSEVGRSKILRLSKEDDGNYDCSAKCLINGKTCELTNLPPQFLYEQQNGGSSAVIALAVILALVVLLVIILLVYIVYQRLRSSSQEKETTDIELGAEKKEPLLAKKDPEYENLPSPREPTNAGSQMVALNESEKGKNVMGVTWLDNKIYVLLDGKEIHVFSDQKPFNKFGDPIKVDEIMNPTDITSWSVDNCLFISDYSDKNCFWKIQMPANEITSHTTSGKTSKLSVAKEAKELLVIVRGAKSAYLEIHKLADLRFSMIFNFPEEIRKPVGVLKASNRNILVLYAVEADHYLVGEISDENIPKIVQKFDFTGPGVDSPKADHVAVDRHGRVFVSDLGNGRIFMLNKELRTSKKIQMDLNSYRLSYVEEKNMLIAATWSPGSFTVFDV